MLNVTQGKHGLTNYSFMKYSLGERKQKHFLSHHVSDLFPAKLSTTRTLLSILSPSATSPSSALPLLGAESPVVFAGRELVV